MQRTTRSGRAVTLVLEIVSGTAVLDGERIELPAKELKLLAVLAARPGEAIASPELIAQVWPETPWMTSNDLYWHVSQLRRDLGGSERVRNMIRNRRSFGYLLDLPAGEVVVIEADPQHEAAETIRVPIERFDEAEQEDLVESGAVSVEPQPTRPRTARLLSAAVLIFGLIAASWGAGFLLSRWRATRALDPVATEPREIEEPRTEPQDGAPGPRRNRPQKREQQGDGRHKQKGGSTAVGGSSEREGVAPSESGQEQQPPDRARKRPPPQPAVPPAPTRYLYHLANAETGDHFVTTDGGVASEYEAKGYEGGPIARVYTYKEDNTKAIATNYGTAYVFIGSSPKTEPASRTVSLWYSTNNAGDFFYTTSKADASQEGWSATLIGYGRTLS